MSFSFVSSPCVWQVARRSFVVACIWTTSWTWSVRVAVHHTQTMCPTSRAAWTTSLWRVTVSLLPKWCPCPAMPRWPSTRHCPINSSPRTISRLCVTYSGRSHSQVKCSFIIKGNVQRFLLVVWVFLYDRNAPNSLNFSILKFFKINHVILHVVIFLAVIHLPSEIV